MILDHTCDDVELVGGKAAALARRARAGWRVPEWFVVPAMAFNGNGAISAELRDDIEHEVESRRAPRQRFAVRSSAIDEDGEKNSFAGQFLSLLSIPPSGVVDAVRQVHASGLEGSVAAYRGRRGSDEVSGPSVIVQRMLQPRASGVMFTADPRTGDRSAVVISAVVGLGDELMAGKVDGWTWSAPKSGKAPVLVSKDGLLPPIGDGDIAMLLDMATRLEAESGSPQDVEWAIEGDELYLLQTRPITGLPQGRRRVFDNSNIVESYPGVVSPMTFSFARAVYAEVYRRLLQDLNVPRAEIEARNDALAGLLARFDGHVYYDLGNWHRLLTALPGYHLNAAAMDQMMGVSEPLPADVVAPVDPRMTQGLQRLVGWLSLVRAAFGLAARAISLPMIKLGFAKRLEEALALPIDFATADADALVSHWRELEKRLLRQWDAPLINDLLCMIAVGAARGVLRKWAGADGEAAFNEALVGQHGIVSAEPPRRILLIAARAKASPEAMRALKRESLQELRETAPWLVPYVEGYVRDFGDRCAEELKLESPTLADDPAPLLRAIHSASQGDARASVPVRTADLGALFRHRPVRRAIAGWLLRVAGNRVRDRENLRFDRTRVFGRVRRIVRALGDRLFDAGRLSRPQDVFDLTVDELQGYVEGWGTSSDLKAIVAQRRKEASRWKAPPDRFDTYGPAHAATRIAPRRHEAESESSRNGLGCSPGIVTGIARVVRDPRAAKVGAGEILVARSTDPGWIALFANAGAVVVEKGSILSHSAIVAREMGIPCVVGIAGVVDWIVDGERIEVDGHSGIVRRTS